MSKGLSIGNKIILFVALIVIVCVSILGVSLNSRVKEILKENALRSMQDSLHFKVKEVQGVLENTYTSIRIVKEVLPRHQKRNQNPLVKKLHFSQFACRWGEPIF
ncbi:methyl-accepting chemotaxis protein [Helicobacter pylori]|nr:methyl-accepting chemotaxis protein [Helicobacter pylori]